MLALWAQAAYTLTALKTVNKTPGFKAFLATYLAGMLALAAVRTPERREAQACLLRLATFILPFWFRHTQAMLSNAQPPLEAGNYVLRAAALAFSVPFITGTLPNIGIALSRRVRLWLQLLVQAAVVATQLSRTGQLCHTPALANSSAEHLLGAAYDGLRWLSWFMPVPELLLLEHTAHARCRWVLAGHEWGMC